MNDIVVSCPHCNQYILIAELNCRIFRHGTFISNGQQINPHANKDDCDHLVSNKMINGCGKPFQIIVNDKNEYIAIICKYI